ncbi:hypothetical protein ACC780_37845, partial [Rhizobium ruizarguesonis]
ILERSICRFGSTSFGAGAFGAGLTAVGEIRAMGYRIAGYSVNGDGGSLLGAVINEKRIASAKDGDVVISHVNQQTHAAGEGVAKALVDL